MVRTLALLAALSASSPAVPATSPEEVRATCVGTYEFGNEKRQATSIVRSDYRSVTVSDVWPDVYLVDEVDPSGLQIRFSTIVGDQRMAGVLDRATGRVVIHYGTRDRPVLDAHCKKARALF